VTATVVLATRTDEHHGVRVEVPFRIVWKLCKVASRPPTNTDDYRVTSRSILWREVVESITRRDVPVSLDAAGRTRLPSVPDRPLQHLSVFRINDLRAVAHRLSHTLVTMRASSSIPFVFSALAPTDSEHPDELCNTS
jgi:hypothetical protein